MRPFQVPVLQYAGIKETVSSLLVQGDRIYLGTGAGNIHVFNTTPGSPDEVKRGISKRPIEQLGYIKDINSLVVLADSQVTLYHLPEYTPTILGKAKAAFSFCAHTSFLHLNRNGVEDEDDMGSSRMMPTCVTQLAVGCRRKLVVYKWHNGEPQDDAETALPHSPRAIQFFSHKAICFGYTPTDFSVISLAELSPTSVVKEVVTPLSTSASTHSGALGGLTGYMSLGLTMGAKQKPEILRFAENLVVIAKEGQAFSVDPSGTASLMDDVEWPAAPEAVAFVKPYIVSAFAPGVAQASDPTSAALQIHSSLKNSQSPKYVQQTSLATPGLTSNVRFITASKSTLYYITTPTTNAVALAEGSSLWSMHLRPWEEQLDDMLLRGLYEDALTLINSESFESTALDNLDQRKTLFERLAALATFKAATKFDEVLDKFYTLHVNPAKVIALYGDNISGRLGVEKSKWIELFGGPTQSAIEAAQKEEDEYLKKATTVVEGKEKDAPTSSRLMIGLGLPLPSLLSSSVAKDEDTSSVLTNEPASAVTPATGKKSKNAPNPAKQSVEALLKYLASLRPKLNSLLASANITPESEYTQISSIPVGELFKLPSAPLESLTPTEQLVYAQIVDTALFKSYLVVRPGLIGSLCRIENWCEVEEVEEELRERGKIGELIDLWRGKRMHKKALALLREIAEKETDEDERLTPSILYLQKLDSEYLPLIFETSRWLFTQDQNAAYEIFISEDVELPQTEVADFLESIDLEICARYLEFRVQERRELSGAIHNRLASLYLTMTLKSKQSTSKTLNLGAYGKLLQFIRTSTSYDVDRLYNKISSEDLWEARAILLGRLGRHNQALEIYVYRLEDYAQAEDYCKRYYQQNESTSGIFLTLLEIYLRPSATSKQINPNANFLQPALELISRQAPRLDTVATLDLLPPLVAAMEVRQFLTDALRTPVHDTLIQREIAKSRNDQVARMLMVLKMNRVKITDNRTCPQCHKRLGTSAIAVHSPRGEVTHFHCREAFSAKLSARQ